MGKVLGIAERGFEMLRNWEENKWIVLSWPVDCAGDSRRVISASQPSGLTRRKTLIFALVPEKIEFWPEGCRRKISKFNAVARNGRRKSI
jgi:hypothetical protein